MRRILFLLVLLLAAGAGYLAYAARDIPKETLIERYGGAEPRFVLTTGGANAHYRDRGPHDGPTLLLLHGSNASLHTFEPLVDLLPESLRVVTVDLPAHGLTGAVPREAYSQAEMVAFVDDFTRRAGIGRFAIGGNSMGGGVAARYAATHPERITHLVLIDAGGISPPDLALEPPVVFTLLRMPGLGEAISRLTPRALFRANLEDAVHRDEIITDAMVTRYFELARMEGARGATLARLRKPDDGWLYAHLEQIEAPTCLLWGREDSWVPLSVMEAYAAKIPGARTRVLEGVGHMPQEEAPAETAAFLADCLAAAPPEAGADGPAP